MTVLSALANRCADAWIIGTLTDGRPQKENQVKRSIAEWLWRAALLAGLGWIGWELMLLHEDLRQPVDDETSIAAADETLDSLDAIKDDLADLTQKVNAILVAMSRSK